MEAYRHFVLNAEKSIGALLDERTRAWEFCHLTNEDPMWVVTNGVVAKETEYKAYPAKRQELIAARTPEMHPEVKALFRMVEEIEKEMVELNKLQRKHEKDEKKLRNAEKELQRRQERQRAKDDSCCVVM
jgi:hypothetical protein